MDITIKPEFKKRYREISSDYDAFIDISLRFLRRSIRINTLKKTIESVKKSIPKWILTPIPWCKEGFWVNHVEGRRDIGNTIPHMLGHYYVQEAASMIPPIVLDPKPGEIILDMCASPGSKSSQIAQYMENKGILLSNDVKGDRMRPLGINLEKAGLTNSIRTLMNGQWYLKSDIAFDRILVDAPCSGTGTIRKSLKTLRIWNPIMVSRLAAIQKQLIETAFLVLKPGGTMVYSTCTLEPEEDEGVIDHLLSQYPDAQLEPIELNIKRSQPILEFEGKKFNPEVKKCLRIWPQDNNTEGFFVSKIKKTSS